MTFEAYPTLVLRIGDAAVLEGRATRPVINPATEEVIGALPMANRGDCEAAVSAAEQAFRHWRRTPAYARAEVLARAAALLRQRVCTLAGPLVLENGKPVREAEAEILASADVLDWFAGEARRAGGRTIPARHEAQRFLTIREPVGVVAAFAPWNFPAINLVRKLAPALAAGCTVVAKPAEETPATPLALAGVLAEAGLPAGALNVIFGEPAELSAWLIDHPAVRKVSFTGSTRIGRLLAGRAAERLKRITLELGGHAPVVVCADADPETVGQMAAAAKFRNAGQSCNAASRFYVHASIHDRFVLRFGEAAAALKVGDGRDPQTQMGPLSNRRRVEAAERFVVDAQARGARIAAGGTRAGDRGYFFPPTVLADVPSSAEIMREEPFAPVAPVAAFDHLDEVVGLANSTPYGLASYVFTDSLSVARRLSREIDAGVVAVNGFVAANTETPFGGVKDSGWGCEGGSEGMTPYLQTKFISES